MKVIKKVLIVLLALDAAAAVTLRSKASIDPNGIEEGAFKNEEMEALNAIKKEESIELAALKEETNIKLNALKAKSINDEIDNDYEEIIDALDVDADDVDETYLRSSDVPAECEEKANHLVEGSLELIERLSDDDILSETCASEERERLLLEIELLSKSSDPCLKELHDTSSQRVREAIASLRNDADCFEEVGKELAVGHMLVDGMHRRGLVSNEDGHRKLPFWLLPVAVFVGKGLLVITIHAVAHNVNSGKRRLRERSEIEEMFDFAKETPFIAPSHINEKCKFMDYETTLIITPGPHFVLGARPLHPSDDCPAVAFDSNSFHESKTMFLLGDDKDDKEWGVFKNDAMFPMETAQLQNIYDAFDITQPLERKEFNVETNNCFHFVQAMWRHLAFPESGDLLEFLVENILEDKNLDLTLHGHGSTEESREFTKIDVKAQKAYIREIAARQLDLSK